MSWSDGLVIAPQIRAVSLDELKRYLRIDFDDNETDLLAFADAATEYVQGITRRQILRATRRLTLQGWPCASVLYLPWPPLAGVRVIRYRADSTTVRTVTADTYTVSMGQEPGAIVLRSGSAWPALANCWADAIEIEYDCGYMAVDEIPAGLRHAILMMAGHYYENRSAVNRQQILEVPLGVRSILDQHTIGDWFTRYDLARG